MQVTFRFVSGLSKSTTIRRDENESDEAMLTRAAKKLWGQRASFQVDAGIQGDIMGRVIQRPTRSEERKGYSSTVMYQNLSVTF